jgi:hypothetical protein
MKTPRELLFEKHQDAIADLDAVRRKAMAEIAQPSRARFAVRLWEELIAPHRWIWTGVAASWMVIAGLNLASGGDTATMADIQPISRETLIAAREQQRELALLFNFSPQTIQPADRPRSTPQPRSELQPAILIG